MGEVTAETAMSGDILSIGRASDNHGEIHPYSSTTARFL
jgi:hypothetical protein